jgi:hypothetical protein
MHKYNSLQVNITTDTPLIEVMGNQITEKDQREIRDLIVALKQKDITDRDLLKVIDYCDHLVSVTNSL